MFHGAGLLVDGVLVQLQDVAQEAFEKPVFAADSGADSQTDFGQGGTSVGRIVYITLFVEFL